jgi:TolA-binding protein
VSRRAVLAVAVLGLAGCAREPAPPAATPAALPAATAVAFELTAADIEAYITVRNRALTRLEETLDEVRAGRADRLAAALELMPAERQAAGGLGVDWVRYTGTREQVARLRSRQRRSEDTQRLLLELRGARDDLASQLAIARDPASRQFLEAQLRTLAGQIGELESERELTPSEQSQLELLESYRAEVALLNGRQERIEREARALARPPGTPEPTASAN